MSHCRHKLIPLLLGVEATKADTTAYALKEGNNCYHLKGIGRARDMVPTVHLPHDPFQITYEF